jgi:hypothetical protein
MESSSQVLPTHLAGWQWIGVIRSPDQQGVESFIHEAAKLGLEVTMSSGGRMLTAMKDDTGQVRYEKRPAFPG